VTERLVIRNANLSILVAEPADVMDDIMKMANSMGGFVVDSNLYQTTTAAGLQVPQAQVTVRVPADQLDAALTQIKAHVKDPINDILFENVTGQDVTQEYTDLNSRLRNLEDAAEQLRSILDEAIRTEDVLAVYNELRNVNEQIEVLKGQIQYYEQSARLSSISVTIQALASVQPINIGGWEPQGVAKEALQSLIRAYQTIADGAIWLVVFCLPIALPVGIVGFFVIRGIRKMNKKRKGQIVEVKPAEKQ
jgi:cysteinyl-tRNA synthetase